MIIDFISEKLFLRNVARIIDSLQENASLVTNFSNQKFLVTIIINLDTSLQSKKIIGY